ncbi:MAG: type VII toxin-antitoxin system MntA family adenylyltransferase antitoxin [Acidiferrobacterales bacterium]
MKQDSRNLPEGSAICPTRILDGARRRLLGQIVARLRSEIPDAVGIYVFGSWGTTAERRDSDLDLAVLARWELAPARSWNIAQELAGLVGRNVDLVDLRVASTVMRTQVIAHGERLFCGDERQCTEFEDLVFSDYARLNEERAGILEDIQRRGSIYGR